MKLKLGKDKTPPLPQPRKVVAAPSNKEGKHYGVQGSHSVVKQAPTKHLYGMGGIRSMKLHPPKLHTEIKHKVVGTNTRGASVFLKGSTAPSETETKDKKN